MMELLSDRRSENFRFFPESSYGGHKDMLYYFIIPNRYDIF